MAADIGLSVVGKITELLFEPIQRELGYLFCFNNNIQELETRLRELEATKNDVQGREDAEQRSWKTLGEAVKLWIVEANGKITEAENVIKDKVELQKGCFSIKWCPNLKLRFSLGRKGKKLSLDLNKLLQSGKDHLLLTGIDLPMPPINMRDHTGDASDFESRQKIMEEIIEILGDKETRLIGICGMGGIGKTTLAKQVLQKVHDFHNNLFEFQVDITVSRPPNFNSIQQQVVERLGIRGSSLKEIDNETLRAEHLRNAFKNKKVVVVLDDVWEEFDLNAKGFPLRESDCCKIIYTSRIQGLWSGELTKKEINLDVLSNKEASDLFRSAVHLDMNDIEFNLKNGMAIEIVNECKGLPLALSITGGALLKKNTHQWEHMLNRMKNHHDQHSKINEALKTSYDFLEEDNEKLLFLICCLFQEDQKIPIETLRRYAVGLHLFKDTSHLREIRVGVHTAVDNLIMKNLLIEVDDDDLDDMERAVKMHDVVRDVGISIAKQDENGFNFLVWDDVNNDIIGQNTKRTSILIQNKYLKVPDRMELGGSKLELLQMDRSGNFDIKIPDNFFRSTDNLKVLAIVPVYMHRQRQFSSSSFSYLAKLKMLSLDNLNLGNFNVSSIAHLSCLEILSLRDSIMKALPNEISKLTNLRLLDLTSNKCFIGNGILSKLTNLQELYMYHSFVNWSALEENNASAELIEFNCLHKLWRLELEVSNIEQVRRGDKLFSSSKLKEFNIIIMRKGEDEDEEFENFKRGERQLGLENVNVNFMDDLEAILENKVTHLHLRNTSGIWEQMHLKGFSKDILHIVLERCQSIITIFPPSKSSPHTFDAQEVNRLDLRRIGISKCMQLGYLFHISISRHLKNLQVIVVEQCDILEEVVSIRKDTKELKIIEFKALETLELNELCRLECFCKGINEIHFHKLKTLELSRLKQFIFPSKWKMPCLEKLIIESIPSLENLSNFLFPSLKEMSISNCDALTYVFSGTFARSNISNLQILRVRECKMLKGILFESMSAEEKDENISFQLPNLSFLVLKSLNELVSFVVYHEEKSQNVLFYHNQVSLFPCLKELQIERLPKINYIVGCKGKREDNDDYEKKLQPPTLFPNLKTLYLGDLSELVSFHEVINNIDDNRTNQNTLFHLGDDEVITQNTLFHLGDDEVSFPCLLNLKIEKLSKITYIVGCKEREDNDDYDKKLQPPTLFPNLNTLNLSDLSELVSFHEVNWTNQNTLFHLGDDEVSFPCLLTLMIVKLSKINYIVGCKERGDDNEKKLQPPTLFPNLHTLYLSNLSELVSFHEVINNIDDNRTNQNTLFHLGDDEVSFPCLLNLKIEKLSKITYIVGCKEREDNDDYDKKLQPPTLFPNLNTLNLSDLSELVSFHEVNWTNQNTLFHLGDDEVSFPCLLTLMIVKLSKINYIVGCKERGDDNEKKLQPPIFPTLEYLDVRDLDNLIHMYESNHQEIGALLFQNVRSLGIIGCGKLRYLFSENIGRAAAKYLQYIWIRNCPMMEVVMKNEEELRAEDDKEGIICHFFPLLKEMQLKDLPCLRRFCDVAYPWTLPSLDCLIVGKCPKLEALSPGYLDSPRLETLMYDKSCQDIAGICKGGVNAALGDLKMMKEKEEEDEESEEEDEMR